MQSMATSQNIKPCLLPPKKKDQELRRTCSEVITSSNNNTADKLIITSKADQGYTTRASPEVETVHCACCGVSEDCTAAYIHRIRTVFCSSWVCGLCAEAVKERMQRSPVIGMEEALGSHMAMCRDFNMTTRLNPKLSLAGSMRDIARKSFHKRTSCQDHLCASKTMARTISCGPRFC